MEAEIEDMPDATPQVFSAVARACDEKEDARNHVDDEGCKEDEP